MTKPYPLGLVAALFLTEVLWAQPTIPPQADQALQRRDDLLKNKKIVWDVTISEEHSEEFLNEMASFTRCATKEPVPKSSEWYCKSPKSQCDPSLQQTGNL
ncbi:MAG: hypothetical protein KatS3mg016_0883 [Fimbriimonadales bacterium]|nr:MAG: hypothetical protein KatS3mg016_0883 [Fimbriimonadales bacterium]